MATQTPFSFLEDLLQQFPNLPKPNLQVPAWAVEEGQRRMVLLLNHVLMQESEAMARLKRQSGRVIRVQWRTFYMVLQATPAGLLDLGGEQAQADLVLSVTDESPLGLAQATLRGERPTVRIEGDVQLAAEVNWLTEHVRWDMEEDLARLIGDVPAHSLSQATQVLMQGLRRFVAQAASFIPGKS